MLIGKRAGRRQARRSRQCLLLTQDPDGDAITKNYHFWQPGSCDEKRAFICQAQPKDVGCVEEGKGDDYRGTSNVTQLGFPCIPWNDEGVLRRGVVFQVDSPKHVLRN